MKIYPITLAGSALALGALLIPAPQSHAAEKNSSLGPADEEFIKHEAASGKAIITIAVEAATRSESEAIRTFARSLVRDHGKSGAVIEKLAQSKGVDLEPGDVAQHEAHLEQLRGERGADFDNEFIVFMIKMHKDSGENFEKTATDSPDTDIKKWASEMLPGLKNHLKKAKDLTPSKTASADASHLIAL